MLKKAADRKAKRVDRLLEKLVPLVAAAADCTDRTARRALVEGPECVAGYELRARLRTAIARVTTDQIVPPKETAGSRGSPSREESKVFERIIKEGMAPLAEWIAKAHLAGKIAVVFFEIAEDDGEVALKVREEAGAFGWRGAKQECGILELEESEKFAELLEQKRTSNRDRAEWFRGERPGRIYVFHSAWTFCFEHKDGRFWLSPRTSDIEWSSSD